MLLLSLIYQIDWTGDLFRNASHDLVAYTFVGVLVLTLAFLRPSQADAARPLKAVTVGLTVSLAALAAVSLVTPAIGPLQLTNGTASSASP